MSLLKHNFDRRFKSWQDGTEKFTAQPRTASKTDNRVRKQQGLN